MYRVSGDQTMHQMCFLFSLVFIFIFFLVFASSTLQLTLIFPTRCKYSQALSYADSMLNRLLNVREAQEKKKTNKICSHFMPARFAAWYSSLSPSLREITVEFWWSEPGWEFTVPINMPLAGWVSTASSVKWSSGAIEPVHLIVWQQLLSWFTCKYV